MSIQRQLNASLSQRIYSDLDAAIGIHDATAIASKRVLFNLASDSLKSFANLWCSVGEAYDLEPVVFTVVGDLDVSL